MQQVLKRDMNEFGHDWFQGSYDHPEEGEQKGAAPVNHLKNFNKVYRKELERTGELDEALKERQAYRAAKF